MTNPSKKKIIFTLIHKGSVKPTPDLYLPYNIVDIVKSLGYSKYDVTVIYNKLIEQFEVFYKGKKIFIIRLDIR